MNQFFESLASFPNAHTLSAAASEAMRGSDVLSASDLGAIIMIVSVLLCVVAVLVALVVAGTWKTFAKAGMPGWASIVPIYSGVKRLEMTRLPLWWIVFLCIPLVNIIFSIMVTRRMAGVFGRGVGFTFGLIFLPFIFYPILGFGKAQYNNNYPPAGPMSDAVRWTLAGALVLVLSQIYVATQFTNTTKHSLVILTGGSDGAGAYATDGDYVYSQDLAIAGADPMSFRLEGVYGIDRRAVYLDGKKILGAQSRSFVVLGGGSYAKDRSNAYYNGEVVQGADLPTFSPVNDFIAKDAMHVFYMERLIQDADPASFEVLDTYAEYSKDAHAVYFNDTLVPDADPKTFVMASGSLGKEVDYDAKDKTHYYYGGVVVQSK